MNDGVFNPRDFGARGDGAADDTTAFAKAIQACAAAGCGMVLVSPGTYRIGTIKLVSRMVLFLAAGSRLAGTEDLQRYEQLPGHSPWHRGLIIGDGLEDVTIAGDGVIDGRKVFDAKGEEGMRGPHAICLANCRRISIRGITIADAANYAMLFLYCDNIEVSDVKCEGGWDGVHFRSRKGEYNRDLQIRNCHFFTGDDAIAGWGMDGLVVKNCLLNSSCNGMRIIGPVKNMIVHECLLYGPGRHPHRTQSRHNMLSGINLQPGAWEPCPGAVENIVIDNIIMQNVACPFNIWLTRAGDTADKIKISRLRADGVYRAAASIESWIDEPIGHVSLQDVSLAYEITPGEEPLALAPPPLDARPIPVWGFYARNLRCLDLDNVRLNISCTTSRPALGCENLKQLRLGKVLLSRESAGVILENVAETRSLWQDEHLGRISDSI